MIPARLRALTHGVIAAIATNVTIGRNDSCPTQGIDTSLNVFIMNVLSMVEMIPARLRALTQIAFTELGSGQNEVEMIPARLRALTPGIINPDLSSFRSRNDSCPTQGIDTTFRIAARRREIVWM